MNRVLGTGLVLVLLVVLAILSIDLLAIDPLSTPVLEEGRSEPKATSPPTLVAHLNRAKFPGIVIDPENRLDLFQWTIVWTVEHQRADIGVDLNVVVFSVPDIPIAQLTNQIFELRKIGRNSPTGGILIVINPERAEARIQVSYSLEGALPDAVLGRIAADQLAPYISYDAMGMGVMDTVELLQRQLYLQAVRGHLDLSDEYRAGLKFQARARFYSGGAGAQLELSSIPSDIDFKRRIERPRRARYAPSSDPLESAEALMRSYREFAGDPTLELLTPGTQIMNSFYPFAPFEKLERLLGREASRPFHAIVKENRAVVTSDRPAKGFVPILLERIDGVWRVDDVELWKNLTTTRDWKTLQRTQNPYSFGLAAFGRGTKRDLLRWDLQGHDLHEVVDRFSKREDALGRYLYADLLVRNAWSFVPALRAYREATALAPDAPVFWETLALRSAYAGAGRPAARAYARMGAEGKEKSMRAWSAAGNYRRAEIEAREVLREDPFRMNALRTLQSSLRKLSKRREAIEVGARIDDLKSNPARPYRPLTLTFSPERPVLRTGEAMGLANGWKVYDYSEFAVTITNTSGRAVEVLGVDCERKGTAGTSNLGDIASWWTYENGHRQLSPGESTTLRRVWGFDEDTAHTYVAHVFHYCWLGRSESQQQCAHTRVDQFPL